MRPGPGARHAGDFGGAPGSVLVDSPRTAGELGEHGTQTRGADGGADRRRRGARRPGGSRAGTSTDGRRALAGPGGARAAWRGKDGNGAEGGRPQREPRGAGGNGTRDGSGAPGNRSASASAATAALSAPAPGTAKTRRRRGARRPGGSARVAVGPRSGGTQIGRTPAARYNCEAPRRRAGARAEGWD